jgi:hypothetical protein
MCPDARCAKTRGSAAYLDMNGVWPLTSRDSHGRTPPSNRMVPEPAKTRESQGFSHPGDALGKKTRKNTAVSACRGSALRKLSKAIRT